VRSSIEELLSIPEELKPGRYTLNCGVLIGTGGWVLFARCYPRVGSAPSDLQKAVMYAAKTSLFEPATRNGKRVEVFTTLTRLVYSSNKTSDFSYTLFTRSPSQT
jgi:hypothetical protein